jgi:acid phosphatase type 7
MAARRAATETARGRGASQAKTTGMFCSQGRCLPMRGMSVRLELGLSARLGLSLSVLGAALALAVAPAKADPVIAAAGDIACEPGDQEFGGGLGTLSRCRAKHTSELLVNAGLAAVLPLGNNQYGRGTPSAYRRSYNPSWGRVKSITRPVPGNQEYRTPEARGYFDYFNGVGIAAGPAGERGKGYYSYEIGAWHLVALNSNCKHVACAAGSFQERWLRADLDAFRSTCTLAYWHHPRFSSSHEGSHASLQPLWRALYDAGADVVLSAGGRLYERFAPLDRSGAIDRETGVRQFIVGTGGRSHTRFAALREGSERRNSGTFGVLELTLHPTGYTWRFVPEAGEPFTDTGTGRCHGRPAAAPGGTASCTIVGTSGDEVLKGTPGNDVICGLAGNDELDGLGGNDIVLGGEGKDRISGGGGRDRALGGDGNDRIRGAGGRDVILGGAGKDRLTGGRSGDRIYGNAGRDIIRGSSGRDRLVGGAGKDRIYGNAGDDRLSALDKRRGDRIDGGKGRDRASVNKGDRTRRVERVVRS